MKTKKIPQYVHFRCGRVHINQSLKKLVKAINYKKVYLKKNWNMMKFMKVRGKLEKTSGYLMLKMTYYQPHSVMLDIQWEWKN